MPVRITSSAARHARALQPHVDRTVVIRRRLDETRAARNPVLRWQPKA
jgi:hypothetical protein